MVAVPAEREVEIIAFGNAETFADVVFRSVEDCEDAEHQGFVRRGVQVVKLRFHFGFLLKWIKRIRASPVDWLLLRPWRSDEIAAGEPGAGAAVVSHGIAYAEDPAAEERVVIKTGIVAAGTCCCTEIPVDPVCGGIELSAFSGFMAEVEEHFPAFRGIFGMLIEPYESAVAFVAGAWRNELIGVADDSEIRAFPADSVPADRVCRP